MGPVTGCSRGPSEALNGAGGVVRGRRNRQAGTTQFVAERRHPRADVRRRQQHDVNVEGRHFRRQSFRPVDHKGLKNTINQVTFKVLEIPIRAMGAGAGNLDYPM